MQPVDLRCSWCLGTPLYVRYHDEEWGVPVHDDRLLFEMLVLEGAQAGLSWLTILKKRDGYRRAFRGFDLSAVGSMTGADEAQLIEDAGIVRHRQKIAAAIRNAQVALEIQKEVGSLERFLWEFVGGTPLDGRRQRNVAGPTRTPGSDAMSQALTDRGMKFVGTTICYAFMQAVGMVNDHLTDCPGHARVNALSQKTVVPSGSEKMKQR